MKGGTKAPSFGRPRSLFLGPIHSCFSARKPHALSSLPSWALFCGNSWSLSFLQVDKHIRRLDTDLARFEADLKEKQIESSDYDSSSSKGKKSEYHHWAAD